jgi:3-deoxy-D-manno-octulosonate 8-phosphate phosphatase (KDO 8-P phosphatase)
MTPPVTASVPPFDPLLLERAAKIQLLVLDVDGVLTDGRLYFDNHGNEMKAFSTRDGLGLKAVQSIGIALAVITGRESRIVADRAASLGIEHVYQGQDDKLTAYHELLHKTGLQDEQVCYAGDDWIDLPLLLRAGLAVSVPDAGDDIKNQCHWVTPQRGGEGAVRNLCELLLEAHNAKDALLARYGL